MYYFNIITINNENINTHTCAIIECTDVHKTDREKKARARIRESEREREREREKERERE